MNIILMCFREKYRKDFAGRQHIQEHMIEVLGKCDASYSDHRKYQELLCVLADFYCQGYEIEGDLLYGGPLPRIGNLPGYPFARQTYWASDRLQREIGSRNSAEREKLHPPPPCEYIDLYRPALHFCFFRA